MRIHFFSPVKYMGLQWRYKRLIHGTATATDKALFDCAREMVVVVVVEVMVALGSGGWAYETHLPSSPFSFTIVGLYANPSLLRRARVLSLSFDAALGDIEPPCSNLGKLCAITPSVVAIESSMSNFFKAAVAGRKAEIRSM
jgi:hypothetical protein